MALLAGIGVPRSPGADGLRGCSQSLLQAQLVTQAVLSPMVSAAATKASRTGTPVQPRRPLHLPSAVPSAKQVAAEGSSTRTSMSTRTSTKSVESVAAKAAPGGGSGRVWVNTPTQVYLCQADKWYVKTKAGEYLSEADAKTRGLHAEHGETCSS